MENRNYPQYIQEQISGVLIKENLKSIADDGENYFLSQDCLIGLYRKRFFLNYQSEISVGNFEVNNELFDDHKAEIQNEKISLDNAVEDVLQKMKIGESVELKFLRAGKEIKSKIALEERR